MRNVFKEKPLVIISDWLFPILRFSTVHIALSKHVAAHANSLPSHRFVLFAKPTMCLVLLLHKIVVDLCSVRYRRLPFENIFQSIVNPVINPQIFLWFIKYRWAFYFHLGQPWQKEIKFPMPRTGSGKNCFSKEKGWSQQKRKCQIRSLFR